MKTKVDIVSLLKCHLLDHREREVPVHWLWRKQPAVLVFLRHFACIACRAHAKETWQNRDEYQKYGARLFFVGNGAPNFIDGFKADLDLVDAPVFTDPSLATFRACGFKRGFLSALGPTSLVQGVGMLRSGHRQASYKKEAGDIWQLGGVTAFNTDGKVLFHHISQALGDFPPDQDVVEVTKSHSRNVSFSAPQEEDESWEWLLGPSDETDLVFPDDSEPR